MDLICIAHDGTPYGHVTINGKAATTRQIGTITGIGEREAGRLIAELETAGVFSRSEEGTIFSRRMKRDNEASEAGREAIGKRWGNDREPLKANGKHPNSTPNRGNGRGADSLEAEAESEGKKETSLRDAKKASIKGTRIPPDWKLTESLRSYATLRGVNPDLAAEEFVNYWAAATKNPTKMDWDRTFENRVLELADKGRFRLPNGSGGVRLHEVPATPTNPLGIRTSTNRSDW